MLILLLAPQPPVTQLGNVNLTTVVGDIWPSLNARGPSDAIFWTEAQIYQWTDEAAKRLACNCGGFVRRNPSLSAVMFQGGYALPVDHVVTLQADLAGLYLRPRNVQEVEALDYNWPATTGQPKAWLEDTQGLRQFTLYPKPVALQDGESIGLFERYTPATVNAANALLETPNCIREYFTFYALAEARGTKETNASMPEIAQWFNGILGQMEQLISSYWGDLA